jgi:nitrogen regulatory protein P-II 1
MSYLLVLVVDDLDDCPGVLDAWQSLGVTGATILESSGLGRLRKGGLLDDLPLIPSLENFMDVREEPHRTIFSVVEDQATVDQMIAAAQDVIGNLDEPHTGFLFVVPVLKTIGLGRSKN